MGTNRFTGVLAVALVVGALAACDRSTTAAKRGGVPAPAAPAPRASVENGLPLGLTGYTALSYYTICAIGADATFSWSSGGWPAFTDYAGHAQPAGSPTSGTVTVANGGATAPQAWASGLCQAAYTYPLTVHGASLPVVSSTWQAQAGIQLDSIIRDSLKSRDPAQFPGSSETITVYTGTNTVSSVVNNDVAAIVFFYFSPAPPSLTLVKTADAASVPAGQQIGFTLTVSNAGPGVAKTVTLTDPLPTGPGLSWSLSPANAACTIAAGTLSCSFGDLAASASATVHVISPTTSLSCGTYGNTGTVQAANAPALQASATTQVVCPQSTPCPGGSFSYQMQANGDLNIVYDQFPAPNDNSYGVNAVGWPNGHRFSDLYNSDHAGFQLVDPSGVVRLSFNIDYLTASPSAPSGYRSLGPSGGDGKMIVGTADGILATTSLDRNLNNVNIPGLFSASHVQQFGSVNLLVSSPPTDPAHQTYIISDPTLVGWDFHDTYFVTITAAKLASLGFDPATWKVEPNLSQLHNSPAKPCPSTTATLSVTKYEVKDKQVKITILNGGTADVFLTALTLQWPTVNGKLMQVKLDGDVVYSGPAIAGGTADLTTAQLVGDQNKRKINHNSSDVYTLVFEKNADPDLSHYAGTVTIGGILMTVLPH